MLCEAIIAVCFVFFLLYAVHVKFISRGILHRLSLMQASSAFVLYILLHPCLAPEQ